MRIQLPSIACLVLSGCAGLTPPADTYAPPAIPSAWSEAPARQPVAGDYTAWWEIFDDIALTSLMKRAVAANLDVRLADARLREARARAGLVAGAGQGTLNLSGSYARERDSQNAPRPVLVKRSGEVEPPSGHMDNLYQARFDASWEIDLFGARSHETDAARADAQALGYVRGAILRTVCAEVARNYVVLRASQQQLVIARADLDAQNDLLALARARRAGGFATRADVARGAAQSGRLAAQIPVFELEVKRSVHRIGVLLGQPPGALMDELRDLGAIPLVRGEFAIDLPSELLRRRPDIQRAERHLAAATARREAAVAELFPRISLVGAAGLASVSASDLFSSASLFTRIGPTVTWPILRRGQIATTIEVRGAQQEQAFVAYRQAIVNAFEEVENALAAVATAKVRRAALADVVRESELALALASSRYRGGMADFRIVLDAQHGLAQSRSELASSSAELATAAIALFKSAGGEWEPTAPTQDAAPANPVKG